MQILCLPSMTISFDQDYTIFNQGFSLENPNSVACATFFGSVNRETPLLDIESSQSRGKAREQRSEPTVQCSSNDMVYPAEKCQCAADMESSIPLLRAPNRFGSLEGSE